MTEKNVGGIDADRLRSIVERIERLEEERRALAADVKDIKAEAKSAGYDLKALNALLKERRQDADEVQRIEAEKELYRHALGMMADTPLGEAAVKRAVSPERSRKSKSDDVSMTMSYTGDDGEMVTTEPFTTADLHRGTRHLESARH